MDFGCDRVVCISLEHRHDKREFFNKLMQDLNIDFLYFNAIKDENPKKGCFQSHAKIISDAYHDNINRLMIFEDDTTLDRHLEGAQMNEILNFLDNEEDWDMFFLSSSPEIYLNTIKTTKYTDIYKGQFLMANAYILSRSGIEKYRNLLWDVDGTTIDRDVYRKNTKSFAYLPPVYTQRIMKNDIQYIKSRETPYFVYLRDKVNRFQIWYALNINIALWKILVFLLACCVYKFVKR